MFGILKTYSDIKKGVKDPTALGQDMAIDVIKGPLVLFTAIATIFFVALFILAFTQLFGGPFLGFKIVFWILFLPAALLLSAAWMLLGKIKSVLEKARNKIKNNSAIEAEAIDK